MNEKLNSTILSNKIEKSILRTPSLQRRRSLKSIKSAKCCLGAKPKPKTQYIGDRIMAHRGVMNFDNIEIGLSRNNSTDAADCHVNYRELSVPNLIDKTLRPSRKRLLKLSIHHESPSADEKLQQLITQCQSVKRKFNRHISIHPERVLDAPGVSLEHPNVMDWSKQNIIAVALGSAVYLWDAIECKVEEIMNYGSVSPLRISCVRWFYGTQYKSDHILALGSTDGSIVLWDSKRKTKIRKIYSSDRYHRSEVISIAIKSNFVSVGRSCGRLEHYDIRHNTNHVPHWNNNQPIRHIKWSRNFHYLAVVAKDSLLSFWTENKLNSSPLVLFNDKVNDLTWSYRDVDIFLFCTACEKGELKLYNISQRICLMTINTDSCISCVLWSEIYDEVAVISEDSDGFRIKILHDDNLQPIVELAGHAKSILCMATNPTGEVTATIGEDEQIRIWNCFQCPDVKKLKNSRNQKSSLLKDLERFR